MKFDEAFYEIDSIKLTADYRSRDDVERTQYSCLEVNEILSEVTRIIYHLQENYEPVLELTRDQKDIWDKSYSEKMAQEDFIYFIDTLEIEDKFTNLFIELFTEFRSHSRVLMNAWLHPESIKVVE